MRVRCEKCGRFFDDEYRWTMCPHRELDQMPIDRVNIFRIRHKKLHWRLRHAFGRLCQTLAWWACDPYDSWMIDYDSPQGTRCATISRGHYSAAKARAKELGGKIVGCQVSTVPA